MRERKIFGAKMFLFKQIFKRSHTIYDCCKVICKLQYLLGCSGIVRRHNDNQFKVDCKSLTYTFFTCVIVVTSLMVSAYVKFQDPYFEEMDTLIKMIVQLELCVSLFMYLSTVVTMVAKAKVHLELYKRLNDLDRILIKEFHCNMNYKILLRKNLIFIGIGVSIYLLLLLLAVSRATAISEGLTNLVAGIAYSCVSGGPHLNGYAQMNIARILQIRFRLLLNLMEDRYEISETGKDQVSVARLKRLVELVQEYNNCVVLCNRVFSISMLTILLHDFTLTTSELYLILGGSATADNENGALLYFVILGLVIPIFKMIVAPIYSAQAMQEIDHCFAFIRNLDFRYPGNMNLRRIVFSGLMWRQNNQKLFTCGNMVLNKALIFSVYSEIFNYILILVQFRMTQDMNNQIEQQKDTIQNWIGVNQL